MTLNHRTSHIVELDEVSVANLFDLVNSVQHASHFDVIVGGQVFNLKGYFSKVFHGVPLLVGVLTIALVKFAIDLSKFPPGDFLNFENKGGLVVTTFEKIEGRV
jgi:hypothetical protein